MRRPFALRIYAYIHALKIKSFIFSRHIYIPISSSQPTVVGLLYICARIVVVVYILCVFLIRLPSYKIIVELYNTPGAKG